jgi:hypothetical protein
MIIKKGGTLTHQSQSHQSQQKYQLCYGLAAIVLALET